MVTQSIQAGYKRTELGKIPEDWEIKKLREISDVFNGGTPKTDIREYWNGKIFWCTPTDITSTKGRYLYETERKITKKGLENSSAKLLPEGSLLLCSRATIGELKISKVEVATNQGFKALVCFEEVDNEFVYYTILTMKNRLIEKATGTTFLEISKKDTEDTIISIPSSKKEQSAIAQMLSDTDDLIESLDKLIEKKKNIKRGAVQNLLEGKKRLPGFRDEWVDKEFSKVCWFQEGPGIRNWQFTKNGMKVINVTNLEKGYLNLESTDRHVSSEEFYSIYRHFEIDEGDIVVASSGNSYGKVALVRKQDLPLMMNTSVIRFKPLKELVHGFLLQYLKSDQFKSQIDLLITGGAQPNFGPAHLKKITIFVPPTKEEQSAIAQVLSDMDSEIEELEQARDKYTQLKKGMMQQLLTGRIRLRWMN